MRLQRRDLGSLKMGFRGKRTLMSAQRKVMGALQVEDRLTLSEDPESVLPGL